MTRSALIAAAVTAASLTGAAWSSVVVSTLQLPEDHRLESVFGADADGDGRDDLVVVTAGPTRRSVRLHLRRDDPHAADGQTGH